MRTADWKSLSNTEQAALLARPALADVTQLQRQVDQIITEVRQQGDVALYAMAEKFDGVTLTQLRIPPDRIAQAYEQVDEADLAAIRRAKEQIAKFHVKQLPQPVQVETSPGVLCQKRALPLERVGLYIPGGSAPLISTVLMLGVPAEIAGCPVRVLATPPQKDGCVNPHILVAADLCGITDIFAIGGAQAIAAMAFGTESVPKVDKVFGPGNAWVTQAKVAVSQNPQGAALDMPAGPSEVLVVVDDTSDAAAAAADLLSQAEHGPDSQVVLVSTSEAMTEQIRTAIEEQLHNLSRRDIAQAALEHSLFIYAEDQTKALEIVNAYAPEHLILLQTEARAFADQVRHAASIFIGPWTPESVGDYASGTNHVLPTYGYARSYSGLGTEAFMKFITYQEVTPAGLKDIGPVVERLAELEGLDAHRRAVSIRLQKLKQGSSSCR